MPTSYLIESCQPRSKQPLKNWQYMKICFLFKHFSRDVRPSSYMHVLYKKYILAELLKLKFHTVNF
jgi:hypothetical protein